MSNDDKQDGQFHLLLKPTFSYSSWVLDKLLYRFCHLRLHHPPLSSRHLFFLHINNQQNNLDPNHESTSEKAFYCIGVLNKKSAKFTELHGHYILYHYCIVLHLFKYLYWKCFAPHHYRRDRTWRDQLHLLNLPPHPLPRCLPRPLPSIHSLCSATRQNIRARVNPNISSEFRDFST